MFIQYNIQSYYQLSVRNGETGSPDAPNSVHSGLSAHPYRTATGI